MQEHKPSSVITHKCVIAAISLGSQLLELLNAVYPGIITVRINTSSLI